MAVAQLDIKIAVQNLATSALNSLSNQFKQAARQITQSTNEVTKAATNVTKSFNPMFALANGLMTSFSLLEGSVMGLAFALMFLEKSMIPLAMLGGLIGLIGGVGAASIQAGSQVEQYRKQLQALIPDAQQAEAAWSWVDRFAVETPFDLRDVIEGFTLATAVGIPATERFMKAVGDAATAMNKDMLYAVNTVADAQVGIFRQLQQFGIEVISETDRVIFQYVDKAGQHAEKIVQKFDQAGIREAIVSIFEAKFGDAMEKQMDTVAGQWEKLKDNIFRVLSTIGNMLSPLVKFIVDQIASAVEWIHTLLKAVQQSRILSDLGDAVRNFGNALAPITPLLREIARIILSIPIFVFVAGVRALTVLINALAEGLRRVVSFIQPLLSGVKSIIDTIGRFWGNLVKMSPEQLIQSIKNFFMNLPEFVKNALTALGDFIKDNWRNWYEAIKNAFTTAWQYFINTLPSIIGYVKMVLTPILEFAIDMLQVAKDFLLQVGRDLVPAIVNWFLENPLRIPLVALAISGFLINFKEGIFRTAVALLISEFINAVQKHGPEGFRALGEVIGTILVVSSMLGINRWIRLAAIGVALLFQDEIVNAFKENSEKFSVDLMSIIAAAAVIALTNKLPGSSVLRLALSMFGLWFVAELREQVLQAMDTQNEAQLGTAIGAMLGIALAAATKNPILTIAGATVAGDIIGKLIEGFQTGNYVMLSQGIAGVIGAAVGFIIAGPAGAVVGAYAGELVAFIIERARQEALAGDYQSVANGLGMLLGSAIGFILAGPPGAALGAMIGLLVGDIVGKIANWFSSGQFKEEIFRAIYNLMLMVEPAITQALGPILEFLGIWTSEWKSKWNETKEAVASALNAAHAEVERNTLEMARKAQLNVSQMEISFVTAFNNMRQVAETQMTATSTNAAMRNGEMRMQLGQAWEAMRQDYESTWLDILTQTTVNSEQIKQEMNQLAAEQSKVLTQQFPDYSNTYKTEIGVLQDRSNKAVESVESRFLHMRDKVKPLLTSEMPQALDHFHAKLTQVMDGSAMKVGMTTASIVNDIRASIDNIKRMADEAIAALNAIPREITTVHTIITRHVTEGSPPSPEGQHAAGGSVGAGRRYLVGERGPEIFVPDSNGRIIPTHQLGMLDSEVVDTYRGGDTYIINIDRPTVLDRQMIRLIANEVSDTIAERTKLNRRVLPPVG